MLAGALQVEVDAYIAAFAAGLREAEPDARPVTCRKGPNLATAPPRGFPASATVPLSSVSLSRSPASDSETAAVVRYAARRVWQPGRSAGPQRPDPGMVVITDAVTCRCSLASRVR